MLGLFNATMRPGIELVLDLLHAREACAWADVVITGEGSIDGQTPYGKVPSGIARLAKSQGKPVIAIGGKVTRDPNVTAALNEAGIVATFGIATRPSRSAGTAHRNKTQRGGHLCRHRQSAERRARMLIETSSMRNRNPACCTGIEDYFGVIINRPLA